MAAGVPKKFSDAEIAKRTARLRKAQKNRAKTQRALRRANDQAHASRRRGCQKAKPMNELFESPEPKAQAGLPCSDLLDIPSSAEKRIGFAHDRDFDNGKEEWLTPPEIIKALSQTWCDGDQVPWPFDLDPCAPIKRPWAMATTHFTAADNGLIKPWHGRVWCNPPVWSENGRVDGTMQRTQKCNGAHIRQHRRRANSSTTFGARPRRSAS